MAVTTTTWNPSSHPVHQLVQILDVVVAASKVFRTEVRRLDYELRQDCVIFSAPGDEARVRFRQLVSEHRLVWAELFVRDNFGAGEVARQLTNEVTAYFAAGGYPAINSTLAQIHDVLAWVKADPPMAELEPSIDLCPSVGRNRQIREARDALVAALGRLGETIPRDIDQRVRRRIDSYPMGVDTLPSHAELMSWAKAVRPEPAPNPKAPDAGPIGSADAVRGVAADTSFPSGSNDRSQPDASDPNRGTPKSGDRTGRDPGKPGRNRQNDILAAIRDAGNPLMRPEIVDAMRLGTEGKLGAHLAWMVKNKMLINIPEQGYWPAGEPLPE